MKKIYWILLIGMSLFLIIINCNDRPTEPKPTNGMIAGHVESASPGNLGAIHPAYIFVENRLLATTDANGDYEIDSLEEGIYQFTCSALNYRDTTEQVHIRGGQQNTHNFSLAPDSVTGRLYGEFQDVTLFNQNLQINPAMSGWDAKRIFDSATGATVQAKTFGYEIPDRKVFLGDSLLAISDVWGQYWFEIQCGTYPITGSCQGYHDSTVVIKVIPNTKVYVNFFLRRKGAAR